MQSEVGEDLFLENT